MYFGFLFFLDADFFLSLVYLKFKNWGSFYNILVNCEISNEYCEINETWLKLLSCNNKISRKMELKLLNHKTFEKDGTCFKNWFG